MCEADGACHEAADVASPRTEYSGRTVAQRKKWFEFHDVLASSAEAFAPTKEPLVFLGDSITETWLGTSYGDAVRRASGAPAMLEAKFGSRFDPIVLAISGDQTQHLMWRLDHGELPREASKTTNATFVVMIGTNNLGNGHLPGQALAGVNAVADLLLQRASGRVQGRKPRG